MILPSIAVQGILPEKTYQSAKILALTVGIGGVAVAITLMVGYVAASPTFGWTGGPRQSHVLACTGSIAFFLACKPVCSAAGQAVCALGVHGPNLSFLPVNPLSVDFARCSSSPGSLSVCTTNLTSSDSHPSSCVSAASPVTF